MSPGWVNSFKLLSDIPPSFYTSYPGHKNPEKIRLEQSRCSEFESLGRSNHCSWPQPHNLISTTMIARFRWEDMRKHFVLPNAHDPRQQGTVRDVTYMTTKEGLHDIVNSNLSIAPGTLAFPHFPLPTARSAQTAPIDGTLLLRFPVEVRPPHHAVHMQPRPSLSRYSATDSNTGPSRGWARPRP